jgi:dihydroorotase-like cyclic amidohydrolase
MGPLAVVNPPLRSKSDVKGLWPHIHRGTFDTIGSDHAPKGLEEKEIGWKNIWKTKAGMPSLETMIPVLLNQVNQGRLSLHQVVKLCCHNPAKIFGLYPKKGGVVVGSDADIVIVDMKKKVRLNQEKLYSKVGYSPYHNWEMKGVPVMTLVRGQVVMEDGFPGKILSKAGYGESCQTNQGKDGGEEHENY